MGGVGVQRWCRNLSPDLNDNGKAELTSTTVDDQLEKAYRRFGPRDLPGDFRFDGVLYYSDEKAIAKALADTKLSRSQTLSNAETATRRDNAPKKAFNMPPTPLKTYKRTVPGET